VDLCSLRRIRAGRGSTASEPAIAVGPIWFYEGFAVFAADQYVANEPQPTNSEIWSIVEAKKRGSYQKYKTLFKHFLRHTTLQEYLEKAGSPSFLDWLKTLDKTGT
jgi:hypothetical protein